MIVVVGTPAWRAPEPPGPDGRACRIAIAAAGRGAGVELLGRTGDDPAGDALVLALSQAHVGHVALLRDPARPTAIVEPIADDPSSVSPPDENAPSATPESAASAPVLEPADVSLGLRYLASYDVIVLTDDIASDVVPVVSEAAEFGGAHLVVLVGEGAAAPVGLPSGAVVLEAPADDPDGGSHLVGAYAAALDAGEAPADAFATARGTGWQHPVA